MNEQEGALLFAHNAEFYFGARVDGDHALWKTDGTAEGTVLVLDYSAHEHSFPFPQDFAAIDDTLYVLYIDGPNYESALWKTDGTPGGATLVKEIPIAEKLTAAGDLLFLIAGYKTDDKELWRSDGTDAGTFIIDGPSDGKVDGWARSLSVLNGIVYFENRDTDLDLDRLWRSDGTEAGTTIVTSMKGIGGIVPTTSALFFRGTQSESSDTGLWTSDGTGPGTSMLAPVYGSEWWLAVGNRLYFSAYQSSSPRSRDLWTSDGTVGGTGMLANFPRDEYSPVGALH